MSAAAYWRILFVGCVAMVCVFLLAPTMSHSQEGISDYANDDCEKWWKTPEKDRQKAPPTCETTIQCGKVSGSCVGDKCRASTICGKQLHTVGSPPPTPPIKTPPTPSPGAPQGESPVDLNLGTSPYVPPYTGSLMDLKPLDLDPTADGKTPEPGLSPSAQLLYEWQKSLMSPALGEDGATPLYISKALEEARGIDVTKLSPELQSFIKSWNDPLTGQSTFPQSPQNPTGQTLAERTMSLISERLERGWDAAKGFTLGIASAPDTTTSQSLWSKAFEVAGEVAAYAWNNTIGSYVGSGIASEGLLDPGMLNVNGVVLEKGVGSVAPGERSLVAITAYDEDGNQLWTRPLNNLSLEQFAQAVKLYPDQFLGAENEEGTFVRTGSLELKNEAGNTVSYAAGNQPAAESSEGAPGIQSLEVDPSKTPNNLVTPVGFNPADAKSAFTGPTETPSAPPAAGENQEAKADATAFTPDADTRPKTGTVAEAAPSAPPKQVPEKTSASSDPAPQPPEKIPPPPSAPKFAEAPAPPPASQRTWPEKIWQEFFGTSGANAQTPSRPVKVRATVYFPGGCKTEEDYDNGCVDGIEGGKLGNENNPIGRDTSVVARGYKAKLAFGDIVKLTNPDTGKTQYAIVGDVCPACGTGIDIPIGLSKRLDSPEGVEKGETNVDLELVSKSSKGLLGSRKAWQAGLAQVNKLNSGKATDVQVASAPPVEPKKAAPKVASSVPKAPPAVKTASGTSPPKAAPKAPSSGTPKIPAPTKSAAGGKPVQKDERPDFQRGSPLSRKSILDGDRPGFTLAKKIDLGTLLLEESVPPSKLISSKDAANTDTRPWYEQVSEALEKFVKGDNQGPPAPLSSPSRSAKPSDTPPEKAAKVSSPKTVLEAIGKQEIVKDKDGNNTFLPKGIWPVYNQAEEGKDKRLVALDQDGERYYIAGDDANKKGAKDLAAELGCIDECYDNMVAAAGGPKDGAPEGAQDETPPSDGSEKSAKADGQSGASKAEADKQAAAEQAQEEADRVAKNKAAVDAKVAKQQKAAADKASAADQALANKEAASKKLYDKAVALKTAAAKLKTQIEKLLSTSPEQGSDEYFKAPKSLITAAQKATAAYNEFIEAYQKGPVTFGLKAQADKTLVGYSAGKIQENLKDEKSGVGNIRGSPSIVTGMTEQLISAVNRLVTASQPMRYTKSKTGK